MFLETFFRPDLIAKYSPAILQAMLVTIAVGICVVLTGLLLGLALAIVRSYRIAPVSALVVLFVDLFRALPPLVLVLIGYFGLPNVGIGLPNYVVLWLVLSLVLAAFVEEIFGRASCRSARGSGMRRAPADWASRRASSTSCCRRRCECACRRWRTA